MMFYVPMLINKHTIFYYVLVIKCENESIKVMNKHLAHLIHIHLVDIIDFFCAY